ncbi:MAG: aromatic amino acid lyase, partial [Bacilli bacterium]|nr:aromatic amino acid lyase [Bacilli bacterium]
GSLGASGDLAPLAHMSLPLIGLGEVTYKGLRLDSVTGMAKAGIMSLEGLQAKEGLCLINGTQAMTSLGAITLYDALKLEKHASLSLALSMEALEAISDAFDNRVHQVRGHKGQIEVAKRVRDHLVGSSSITHDGEKRVQDAYSIRCAPQVHGACLDGLMYVKSILETEMNAVTDNPILFVGDDQVISAGNFHGEPVALAMDHMAIAISELANISERRIERMVNSTLSNGLKPFLALYPGINSGFMIVQYSAASIVSENKSLAHPASVDSIPSSANQEDHVSMGTIGALKASRILENTRKVIGMEFLTACQAIDLRKIDTLGQGTSQAYAIVRSELPFLEADTVMYPLIHKIEEMIKAERFSLVIDKG